MSRILKTWKMSLPEESQAWRDMAELGRELGMQPAETARVIIVEWSRSLHGRLPGSAQTSVVVPQPVVQPPVEEKKENSIDQAKARGKRFAAGILDDDDE